MRPFKKAMKRLAARQRGCIEAREIVRRKNVRIDPVKAFHMPGSLKK